MGDETTKMEFHSTFVSDRHGCWRGRHPYPSSTHWSSGLAGVVHSLPLAEASHPPAVVIAIVANSQHSSFPSQEFESVTPPVRFYRSLARRVVVQLVLKSGAGGVVSIHQPPSPIFRVVPRFGLSYGLPSPPSVTFAFASPLVGLH